MTPDPPNLAAVAARLAALEKSWEREIMLLCKANDERDRRYTERFDGQLRETDLAREALAARLESMNEIRSQLDAQARTLIPRNEVVLSLEAMESRISANERRLDLYAGKETGTLSARAMLFSVIAATGAIVGITLGIVNMIGG